MKEIDQKKFSNIFEKTFFLDLIEKSEEIEIMALLLKNFHEVRRVPIFINPNHLESLLLNYKKNDELSSKLSTKSIEFSDSDVTIEQSRNKIKIIFNFVIKDCENKINEEIVYDLQEVFNFI